MRLSMPTRNLTPSLPATASASRIIWTLSSRVSGNCNRPTSVACVNALIGLKLRFPHSLSQISLRMSAITGALKPARVNAAEMACTRGDVEPLGSPSANRLPSTTCTTPGSSSVAAG